MPAPALDVNWEAVKAHALTHGVREAARAYGVSDSTVKSRCTREGWLTAVHEQTVVQMPPESMRPIASNASKPSVAALYSTDKLKGRSRFRLMKALDKAAKSASQMDGERIYMTADRLAALASTHARLCPEQAGPSTLIQVNVGRSAPTE